MKISSIGLASLHSVTSDMRLSALAWPSTIEIEAPSLCGGRKNSWFQTTGYRISTVPALQVSCGPPPPLAKIFIPFFRLLLCLRRLQPHCSTLCRWFKQWLLRGTRPPYRSQAESYLASIYPEENTGQKTCACCNHEWLLLPPELGTVCFAIENLYISWDWQCALDNHRYQQLSLTHVPEISTSSFEFR